MSDTQTETEALPMGDEDKLAHEKAARAASAPAFTPGRPWELRQNGRMLHRFHDVEGGPTAQQQAQKTASQLFGKEPAAVQKTVTVVPGGDFEVVTSEGFLGSYDTEAAATKAAEAARPLLEKHAAARSKRLAERGKRTKGSKVTITVLRAAQTAAKVGVA